MKNRKCTKCESTKIEFLNETRAKSDALNLLWFLPKLYLALVVLLYWDWWMALVKKIGGKKHAWVCKRLVESEIGNYRCTKCNNHFTGWMSDEERELRREKRNAVVAKTRAEIQATAPTTEAKPIPKRACCPHCGSNQIVPMGHKHKNYSLGKVAGASLIFNPAIGLAAGFLGKTEKRVEFYCQNCGKVFKR